MSTRRLNIIMTPVGSSGDVHPFVGIGRLLRERGHDVTVITAENFRDVVTHPGLGFVAYPPAELFDQVVRDPDLWHPRRGVGLIMRMVALGMRELYDRILGCYEPGRTVLVGHLMSFATRVFEDKHDVPAVTLNLAPSGFRSVHEIPAPAAGKDLSRLPMWVKRSMWWLIDRLMFDRHIEKELNRWRAELGLGKVHRVMQGWVNSPRRVIGLFPQWFGAVQPDWQPSVRLTGFPMFDEADQHEQDPQLQTFLDHHPPPILFTPGSANRQAERFFSAATDAVSRMGRSAIFLTRYPQQLPDPLPEHVTHLAYVPLSRVLPRCCAIVHHGGIGTCAQGLAAAIPQLVMPLGFDQPDNVTRLNRLGVGTWLEPHRFTPDRLSAKLDTLLGSTDVQNACREWADRIDPVTANEQTCDLIEQAAQ